MKNKPFGLDIGASTMKAVWFSEEKDSFTLRSASTFPTPAKGVMSESPLDQEAMVVAIRTIVAEAKITVPHVNIALPENQVYTKVLEVPLLSDKELSSAIYWEAEQYIPVSLANITIDYKVLRRSEKEGSNKMDVLLVGAPTLLIEKYQKIIEASGLTINSMETEILSVIRACTKEQNFPNCLIVHIGSVSTLLALIREGVLCFTYLVPAGGMAISRAIAADFGFTVEQAEEYKKTYGVSEKSLGGKIGQVTAPIMMAIVNEAKKALAFYSEKYKDSIPIQQILLSGGTAKLPGVDMFFANNCGLETVIANPWKVLNHEAPKEIVENAPDYTIAVGLAMRSYE